jgi:hypothetical protein
MNILNLVSQNLDNFYQIQTKYYRNSDTVFFSPIHRTKPGLRQIVLGLSPPHRLLLLRCRAFAAAWFLLLAPAANHGLRVRWLAAVQAAPPNLQSCCANWWQWRTGSLCSSADCWQWIEQHWPCRISVKRSSLLCRCGVSFSPVDRW